ncbi:histidine kinase [Lacrimispora sp.]|uniref:sensor histidine kinase n=1 Tax=Lacrimispora sp. TaxID=2719234 RepID=UPI0032E43282
MVKRSITVFFILFAFLLLLFLSMPEKKVKSPNEFHAVKGQIDLSGWDMNETKILRLDGEWEFYWNQLLIPQDFQSQVPSVDKVYMQVPGLWNGKFIKGEKLPAFGCATYRLVLDHVSARKVMALKKGNARFSSKVYVNGEELISDGLPAQTSKDYRSGNSPKLGFFESDSDKIEILIQVANYEYMNSGIPVSIELGSEDVMLHQHQRDLMLALAIFAVLLTIAFLYLIFFIVARMKGIKEYILPLFSLFCSLFAIGNGLSDQRPLLLILPEISFTMAFKMKDLFLSVNFITLLWVFHEFKNGLIPLRPTKIISCVYGGYLLVILTFPIYEYYKIHQLVMVSNTIILLVLLIRAILLFVEKAEGLLLFVSVLAVNFYSFDCILFSLGFKTDSGFSQVFMLIFAIVMIFLLSLHYLNAIRQLQTSVMRTQEAEIAFLRAQINPHFLYNALNSIAALCATKPQKAEEVVIELSQYLRRSFDFKRIDAMTTLAKEMELLEAYLYIEKTRFGERLQVEYDIDETIILPIPHLILQPLVENAVRHGLMKAIIGGKVIITVKRQGTEAVFTIEDNGIGIEKERISGLLEEKPESGGIGIWNINQRLMMLYKKGLTIESEVGKGTRVIFGLPFTDIKQAGRWNCKKGDRPV